MFTVKEATAFSNAAACILAFIKFIYGRKKRDPQKKNKTLIGIQKCFFLIKEYNMCLILNPSIILSTVIAQTVNEFIPPGVVLISLMFFVIVSIIINIINGIKKFKQETKMLNEVQSVKGNISWDFESKSMKESIVTIFLIF